MKPLRYLFFRIWDWKQNDRRERQPLLVAWISVTVLICWNILGLIKVSEQLLEAEWFSGLGRARLSQYLLIAYLLVFWVVRAIFIGQHQYKSFVREFSSETRTQRSRRTVYIWIYIVATVALPIAMAVIWARQH